MVSLFNLHFRLQTALFALLVISGVVKCCRFPRYLQKGTAWTTNYKDGYIFKGYFRGNNIEASLCGLDGTCISYERKCLSKVTDDKYEVEHIDKDGTTPSQFLCMEFLHRTNSIIQIRESEKLSYRYPNACKDSNLRLDNWPLVSSDSFYKQNIKCPFSGGYNIRLQTSDSRPKCPRHLIPPRLESECEDGDGITINFRDSDCIDEALEMNIEQSLYCAASWTHGRYTFVILRPQADEFKAWCLRLTGTQPLLKIEQGHLFMDLVCDPGDGNGQIRETSNYLFLEFEQHIINAICADQTQCGDDSRLCEHGIGQNCMKFCGLCPEEISPCTFPEPFRGNWLDTTDGANKMVNISFYKLNISGDGSFLCYENDGHDFTNSTMLLQTFDNGCFPRFACLDIEKMSPTTLAYRIGNRVGWPVKNWDRLKSQVCDPKQFRPNTRDKLRLGKEIEEKPMSILIDKKNHFHVHCLLDQWTGFRERQLYTREDNHCDTCLVYEIENQTYRHSDRILQVLLNCSSAAQASHSQCQTYKCMASLPQTEDIHAVITRSLHKHEEYLCWVFVFENKRSTEYGRVYIIDPADCNSVAIDSLLAGILQPKHEYVMPTTAPRPCPYMGELLRSPECVHTTTTHSNKEITDATTKLPYFGTHPIPSVHIVSSQPSTSGQITLHGFWGNLKLIPLTVLSSMFLLRI